MISPSGISPGTAPAEKRKRNWRILSPLHTADATVELSRVGGVYGIRYFGDSFDESEQICQ